MKKLIQRIKACPLALCLLLSWGAVAAVNYLPKLYAEKAAQETDEDAANALDWLSDGAQQLYDGEDMLSGSVAANRAPQLSEQALMHAAGDEADADTAVSEESVPIEPSEDTQPQKIRPEYLTYEKTETDSPYYSDPGKIPQTTAYDYQTVKKSYFDDAVFIGDSRIVGMHDYSGLDHADFFAKTGLTVYNLLDDKFVEDKQTGKKVSVSYMLQNYSYGKIYLMVGINELGTGGTERFRDTYKEVLKKIRKWQPDAVIYVQSIMGVSPAKDRSDEVFNNTNIRDKNYAISKLTDGIHIFYLNIQEVYEDENHALRQELTFDDVHLYAQHYDKWVKYLKTHAVVKGEER